MHVSGHGPRAEWVQGWKRRQCIGCSTDSLRTRGRESYSILNSYEVIRSHVSSGIFPFARTPGGEDLCFDYRGSPEQPRIVLVSTEGSVHPVANSFQEFMDGLYDD
ncbi:SMI1/KNR4 family protein [Cystobacter fuscus]